MTDPKRWLDDPNADPEIQDLFRDAKAPDGMSDDAKKKLALVAAQIAAGGVAAGTAGTASALGAAKVVKVIGALLLVGGVTAGTVVGVRSINKSSSVEDSRGVDSSRDSAPTKSLASSDDDDGLSSMNSLPELPNHDEALPSGKLPPSNLSMERVEVRPSKRVRRKAKTDSIVSNFAGEDSAKPATTVKEAQLLEQARAALATQPGKALVITSEHKRSYAQSRLAAEREFIAIQALLGLGRNAEAIRRGNSWVKRHPQGLYSRRIKKMMSELHFE